MRITPELLGKHGYTESCEGCKFKRAGLKEHRGHSEMCRRRLQKAMEDDDEDREKVKREDERSMMWHEEQDARVREEEPDIQVIRIQEEQGHGENL